MAIIQTGAVKAMPYLMSSVMSLGTCFVYALIVLVIGRWMPILFQSWTLTSVGTISYEIYPVHVFSLRIIDGGIESIAFFIIVTVPASLVLHFTHRKLRI